MKNIIAKKKFGQNFLKDQTVLNKIIEAMPKNTNHVVEIGPGLGDLTKQLVKYKEVTAYEVDIDLYSILQKEFQSELESNRLDIILGDVLKQWERKNSLHTSKYDLIANLPYYIATNIILKALDDQNCEHIIVMIQKEVADKFTANVTEKEFSALSVITKQLSLYSETITIVPPESFEPAPKVDSAVIMIKKDLTKTIDQSFKKFLKVAFAQPRKKLAKNLVAAFNKEVVSEAFKQLQIDENLRPHEVDASLYSHLYKKVIHGRESNNTIGTK
ncbi:MAG: 16S rRNA (adenine(1518)-N(6)/adenine(1519)-N(6))-dimethyltransferase RsmA, partial [Campylobacterales bacterium]|nr:16S rRNA (adenine(1518)-N(6)/adenine(1519)-N(6))-dimethyltransferase RsmA [Campylobacterales bacterium]